MHRSQVESEIVESFSKRHVVGPVGPKSGVQLLGSQVPGVQIPGAPNPRLAPSQPYPHVGSERARVSSLRRQSSTFRQAAPTLLLTLYALLSACGCGLLLDESQGGLEGSDVPQPQVPDEEPRFHATNICDQNPHCAKKVFLRIENDHTCLLRDDGTVYCWGKNDAGNLGTGDTLPRYVATKVVGVDDAVQLDASSFHGCVIGSDQTVHCWGSNREGECGVQDRGQLFPEARQVPGVSDAIDVATGEGFTCALTQRGDVLCWGKLNGANLSKAGGRGVPTRIGLRNVVDIEAGREHACARNVSNEVICWGTNRDGVLGREGETTHANRWQPVPGMTGAIGLGLGYVNSCAIFRDGKTWCWGGNNGWQLAQPRNELAWSAAPIAIELRQPTTTIGPGFNASCVSTRRGRVECWGQNNGWQTARPDFVSGPEAYRLELTGVREAANGHLTSCALKEDGDVYCWGRVSGMGIARDDINLLRVPQKVLGFPGGACSVDAPCPVRTCTNGACDGVVES